VSAETRRWLLGVAVGLLTFGFSAAMFLGRYALASDLAETNAKVQAHDVSLGRFDEDLHWIMDRLDAPGAPPRPQHR
jgi:hypothetical protein